MNNAIKITRMDIEEFAFNQNITIYLSDVPDEVSRVADPDYEQFLADVWVGIVLTLMVLSCVCCMCSCLLYHKFQQWKRSVLESRRNEGNVESSLAGETESLPSYTIVSGLPSYDEALEQFRKVHTQSKNNLPAEDNAKAAELNSNDTPPSPISGSRLSVAELFQLYKNTTTPVDYKINLQRV